MEIDALSDPKNAEFFLKLNPTAKTPCAGVRIPQMRILAKKIAKDNYREFLDNNPLDSFEMELLQVLVIGYAKDDINVLLEYLRKVSDSPCIQNTPLTLGVLFSFSR